MKSRASRPTAFVAARLRKRSWTRRSATTSRRGSALEGLSLYVQGQNLTNAPFITTNPGDSREVIDYQTYGRRFLAGFTYKF
ncbi:hypothetical protein [Novosphingobium resinovorum]|uniref:hypothetical protein n=1 Tax=Novosphingobium resinovorum TaxID=158500 RepID=UPI003D2E05B9